MKRRKYWFIKPIYPFLASLVLLLISPFFYSCNGALGGSPETPVGVSATTSEEERILLTWEESRKAGIYYIYRGEEEEFDADQDTFAAARAVASFIDLEVEEEKDYFYRVSAANIYGENESLPSASVQGSSHRYSWDTVQILTESPALQGSLAFDSEDLLYSAVLLEDGTLSIHRISGEAITLVDDTLEASALPGKAALALSGETLYAGTVSDGGNLSLWKWTGSTWLDFGSPETGSYGSPTGISLLSLTANSQYLYAAFLFEYTDPSEIRRPAVFRRALEEDSPWLALTEFGSFSSFIETSLASAEVGPGGCTGIRFLLSGNVPTLGLESKAEIRVYRYTNDQWNPLGIKLSENPVQGTLSMTYNPAGGQLYSAFWEAGSPARLEIHQFDNGAWKEISPTGGFLGESINPPALTLRRRNPVVVYEAATGLKVQEYAEEEWKDIVAGKLPDEEISWPGENPFLVSLDLKLHVLYLEDSANPRALLRVYH